MTEEKTIRLLLAYDGSDFCGWQRQDKLRTVQGELENALEKLHGQKISVTGSGRTDSGVHAAGQVAHFKSPVLSMPAEKYVQALNGKLPQDIRILEASQASATFNARYDAKSRTYRYFLLCSRRGLPHELRYAWQIWHRPDIGRLNEMAAYLKGELDCSTFATPQDPSESRHRFFYHAGFYQKADSLIFEIRANAFLWKMVRSIVGSLIHYEAEGATAPEFASIVASGQRSLAGPTAPPQGLFLWHVDYYRD